MAKTKEQVESIYIRDKVIPQWLRTIQGVMQSELGHKVPFGKILRMYIFNEPIDEDRTDEILAMIGELKKKSAIMRDVTTIPQVP